MTVAGVFITKSAILFIAFFVTNYNLLFTFDY
jgi:hypothetical protein